MQRNFYFFLIFCTFFLGCASSKWDHFVEYDDVYVTQEDQVIEEENLIRMEEFAKTHPEEAAKAKKEKKKLNPRVKRALVWIGGFLGQIALDALLYFLLTG